MPKYIYPWVDPRVRKSSLLEMRTAQEEVPYSLEHYDVVSIVFVKLCEIAMADDLMDRILVAAKP